MALTVYEESNISAIADKIREKTSGTATYTTEEMPDGVAEVYEAGKKAEYDAFWNNYQENGNRENYGYAFDGIGWTDETYNPKYPMNPTYAYNMFHNSRFSTLKVPVDFSKCTEMRTVFAQSIIAHLGVIDFSSASVMDSFVYGTAVLTTIDKLIMHEGIKSAVNAFTNARALGNVTIEGVIATSIDIHWSPLSYDSIISIISHLSDTASGRTLTLSKAAVNKAFETSAAANDGSTSPEWLALVSTKQNWAISLV